MRYKGLNLGCFDCPAEGWLNTDITHHIYIARIPWLAELLYRAGKLTDERIGQHREGLFRKVRYLNVSRHFPFPDSSFEAVFSSHMLEHLPRHQAQFCISECHRILKTGGICRISVPDLDKIVDSYSSVDADTWLTKNEFFGTNEAYNNQHHWYYNSVSLIALLHSVGFREAHRCEFQKGHCPDLNILDNRPDSLFVEAVK